MASHLSKAEKISKLKQWLNQTALDPAIVKQNLGVEDNKISAKVLLASSEKLIKINKKEAEPDDRDNLKFSNFLGAEDQFEEHVAMDAGRYQQKAAYKMQTKKNLSWLHPGFFNPQIRSTIIGNSLAVNVDGINPLEFYDNSHRITKMGPGGIPCYCKDTEVLTLEGFKLWRDVTGNDRLAGIKDGVLDYFKPLHLYKKKYCGLMHMLSTDKLNYLVTPDHSCYISVRHIMEDGKLSDWSTFTFVTAKYITNFPSYLQVRFKANLEAERDDVVVVEHAEGALSTVEYDDYVYCAEVPGHLLYVRRAGKAMWSGNSSDAIPSTSRNVAPSSFGFYDPVHISESTNIGVTNYINNGVGKGKDNQLYRIMKTKDGLKWMSHTDILNRQVKIPEY